MMNLNEMIEKKLLDFSPKKIASTQAYDENKKRIYITMRAQWMAWQSYSLLFGNSQTWLRISERGGFGEEELDAFYPEWRNHIVKP